MKKYSFVRRADWVAFVVATDPRVLAYPVKYESPRFPNFLLVCMSEGTWQLAKATGKFITIPAPWVSVKRLPAGLQTALGQVAADAATIGDVIEDLVGNDIFRD